jgi:hypothetical protein
MSSLPCIFLPHDQLLACVCELERKIVCQELLLWLFFSSTSYFHFFDAEILSDVLSYDVRIASLGFG